MSDQSISLEPIAKLHPSWRPLLSALGLGLAADLLLFEHWGAGTGLFILLLSLAIGWCGDRARRTVVASLLGILFALPLLETADSLSALALAVFGLGLAAVIASNLWDRRLASLGAVALRFGLLAPFRPFADLGRGLVDLRDQGRWLAIPRALALWIVPLALAALFLWLFSSANPLIEAFLGGLLPDRWVDGRITPHLVFAGAAAFLSWPFLAPKLLRLRPRAERIGPVEPMPFAALLGPGMVLRALLLFNLLFAVETLLDLSYLWAGLRLPDGMTYAEYAHRGAYPLVATALIAAGFVLVALRPGSPSEGDRRVRALVYLFLAQNVLLVASSLLRLHLYVSVYALTQFRLVAGLWMLLVAAGLVLILVRILSRRSNSWLVGANLASLVALGFVVSVIDLDREIARFNFAHAADASAAHQLLHVDYLYELSPTILPDLDAYLTTLSADAEARPALVSLRAALLSRHLPITDWRDWSARGARLDAYLATLSHPMDAP